MKYGTIFLFLLINSGCDIAQIRPEDTGKCMQHWWIKGTYRVIEYKAPYVFMRNLKDGSKREISTRDHGWKEVRCPNFEKKQTEDNS